MKRQFYVHYNVSVNLYGFRGNSTDLLKAQELNLTVF
jgi:hypothetical protein